MMIGRRITAAVRAFASPDVPQQVVNVTVSHDLTEAQLKDLTAQVQRKLLEQARRGHMTSIPLRGSGA